jgi:dinuclear metal center YbgI/SA1388 family protein
MTELSEICTYLDQLAPPQLAEEWDNVGLLAGDPRLPVERVMTCLTVTPASAAEAVQRRADLVIAHHPLPFRPLKRLVTTCTTGKLLWELLTHRVAIYSPHTAFDSTLAGINQRLADGLRLQQTTPLVAIEGAPAGTGAGRMGQLAGTNTLQQVADRLIAFLEISQLQYVGQLDTPVQRVAVACGAAGEFLAAAREAECDLLVLGETNLHTCLEAEATGVALLLPGHYASERFAVEELAELLGREFRDVEVWASTAERDPLRFHGISTAG